MQIAILWAPSIRTTSQAILQTSHIKCPQQAELMYQRSNVVWRRLNTPSLFHAFMQWSADIRIGVTRYTFWNVCSIIRVLNPFHAFSGFYCEVVGFIMWLTRYGFLPNGWRSCQWQYIHGTYSSALDPWNVCITMIIWIFNHSETFQFLATPHWIRYLLHHLIWQLSRCIRVSCFCLAPMLCMYHLHRLQN